MCDGGLLKIECMLGSLDGWLRRMKGDGEELVGG